MKLSRRDFVHAGCAIAATFLAPHFLDKAEAGLHLHGSSAAPASGQSVVNIGNTALAFINLAHGLVLSSPQTNFPTKLTADGYPNDPAGTAITSGISDVGFSNWDPTYYGRYKVWWLGTGCLLYNGVPAIVYSGGTSANGVDPSASGTVANNFAMGAGTSTQPRQTGTGAGPVVFAFGALVTGVSGGNGSLVTIAHTAATPGGNTGFRTGTWVKLGTGVSSNLATGPNFDGSWSVTPVDSTHCTLDNSTGVVSPTVTGTGGAGTQSEIICRVGDPGNGQGATFPSGQVYSSFSGLVICKSANEAAVLAGQLASPEYVTAIAAMNPEYIRFMDYTAVQNDRSSSHTYRTTTSNLSWGVCRYVPDYYVGTATNTGVVGAFTDVYTCSNPVASGAGAYADGEQVTVQMGSANAGIRPALNVNGRGSKPILTTQNAATACQQAAFFTGSLPTNGAVQTLTFSGAGLSGSHNVTYTKVSGDSAFSTLGSHLADAVRADATLAAAGVFAPFNGAPSSILCFSYNPNIGGLGSSPLVVTGTDASGNTTYSFGTCAPGVYTGGAYCTFAYSKLIGAWLATTDNGASNSTTIGPHYGPPLEFYVDICNRTSSGLYLNIGQLWSQARITSTTTLIAGSLSAGLKFKPGYSNETWNPGAAEWIVAQSLGCCLGFLNTLNGGLNIGQNALTGLRTAQISELAAAAWTGAGRSRSDLRVEMEYWFIDMRAVGTPNGTVTDRFEGALLNPATNTMLANFGAIGVGAVSTNYSASPNRPIDLSDDAGGAPYYAGMQMNAGGAAGITSGLQLVDCLGVSITITAYNSLLLASWNYANGNTAQKAAALDFLYDGTNGDFYNGTLNGTQFQDWQLAGFDITAPNTTSRGVFGIGSVLQSYDSSRASAGLSQLGHVCYEGGLQSGPLAGDIPVLITSLNNLGDTAGYTSGLPGAASGSSTVAGDAANIAALLIAFLSDNRYKLLTLKYLTICQQAGRWVSGSTFVNTRPSMGTTYGFEGPGYWSIYNNLLGAVPQAYGAVGALTQFDN